MSALSRMKNRALARVLTRYPSLSRVFIDGHGPRETEATPWTPVTKPLAESKVAIVTTAGVQHRGQRPFDMHDPEGDPGFRLIDGTLPAATLKITHDYYDHADADRDINVVFPLDRLRELQREGAIGGASGIQVGFMGHIEGHHIRTLLEETAPEAARILREAGADAVLLTPG